MKNYNELINTMLTALNVNIMRWAADNGYDGNDLHMIVVCMPDSFGLKPARILAPTIDMGLYAINHLLSVFRSEMIAMYRNETSAAKRHDIAGTLRRMRADFHRGYYTIDGLSVRYEL